MVRVLLHILARREIEEIDRPPVVVGKPQFEDFLCLVSNTPSLASSPDRYKLDMYSPFFVSLYFVKRNSVFLKNLKIKKQISGRWSGM